MQSHARRAGGHLLARFRWPPISGGLLASSIWDTASLDLGRIIFLIVAELRRAFMYVTV